MYCPVVVLSPASSFVMKRKQRSNGAFVSPKKCTRSSLKVVCKFWFVRSLHSQRHPKFIANTASEKMSQVRTKECKTGCFICMVNLPFWRFPRHFDSDTAFAVIVSRLNKSPNGSNNIRSAWENTGFQIVRVWWNWKCFFQSPWTFPLWHFGTFSGRIFPKIQLCSDPPDSVAPL